MPQAYVYPAEIRVPYRSNREGLGEAFEDVSVRDGIAADRALVNHYEVVIGQLELAVLRIYAWYWLADLFDGPSR